MRRPRPEDADAALPHADVLDVLGFAPARALVGRGTIPARGVVAARFARRAPELVGHRPQRPDADQAARALLEGVDLVLVEGHQLAPLQRRRDALADRSSTVVARPAFGAGTCVRRRAVAPIGTTVAALAARSLRDALDRTGTERVEVPARISISESDAATTRPY